MDNEKIEKEVAKLKATFNERQKNAFEYLYWYFYGARGSGRTYLSVAMAIIGAMEHPNRNVEILDHTLLRSSQWTYKYVPRAVDVILERFPPEIRSRFIFSQDNKIWTIRFTSEKVYENGK